MENDAGAVSTLDIGARSRLGLRRNYRETDSAHNAGLMIGSGGGVASAHEGLEKL